MPPLISIVTINYNGLAVTRDMLRSLEKVQYPSLEVIVVDNASRESPETLQTEFPWIKLIKSPTNLGFAGGNNVGIRACTGDYILLLNNDTEVEPNFLDALVQFMENHPQVGAISPKVKYFNTNFIQYAGATAIHPITGRGGFIGEKEEDVGQYERAMPSNHCHGAAMLVSRAVLEKVGLMSEFFFLYYEELDFCEKIKRGGYAIWYVPDSTVWHKESMTVGQFSPLKTYYMFRNRILFMRRNVSGFQFLLFLAYFLGIAFPKHMVTMAIKGQWPLFLAAVKGVFWHCVPRRIPKDPIL